MHPKISSNNVFSVFIALLLLATSGNAIADTASSLCINEFMASNSATLADPQGDYEDWIEIYNRGESPVSLMDMYLSDDLDEPAKWQFTGNITLEPGQFLIVWADEDIDDSGIHADFKLSASGEAIGLFNTDLTPIDTVTFEAQTEDVSFGRYPDGTDDWKTFNASTPGKTNTDEISGDIDGSGTLDIADTILTLQICAGMPVVPASGKGRIGLETAVHVIRKLSENSSSSETERPEGWSDETHGDSAEPNYEMVFPDDEVRRIDVIIDPADWEEMMADMTDIYGEFGTGDNQPGGNQPPDNNQNACVGKNEGDACEIVIQGQTVSGSCVTGRDSLVCRPDNPIGGIPGEIPDGGIPGEIPDGGIPGEIPDGGVPGEIPDGGEAPEGGIPGGQVTLADRNPIWKPCTLEFEDKTWYHVGVRFKGNSSLSGTWRSGIWKLPLRFDFDQFEDDYPEIENQRFYGFKKLSMSSNYRDDSFLREKIAADIFRDAGVPAAKTAFYRVYVDHGEGSEYFGLYTMAEIPDDPILNKYFQNTDGNLYKPEGTGATFASFDEASFDKETNEDEADWSDVEALFDALHSSREDAAAWKAELEKTLNVEGFLRWLAVNTLIQNWDTYGNMSHNYYLYNNPEDGLIHWIPWDNNEALKGSDSGGKQAPLSFSLAEVSKNWPLIRYLADDKEYWKKYVAFVKEAAEGAFEPEKIKAAYQKAHNLIRPYVVGEQGEASGYTFLRSPEDFDTALDYLNTHVESRYNEAMEFVGN
jgi:hypothetical protein